MSERTAKAARKEEEEKPKILFSFVVEVHEDGGFALEVPKGAPIPLVLDVLMRAQRKVWDVFIKAFHKKTTQPQIVIPTGVPEGALRRGQ